MTIRGDLLSVDLSNVFQMLALNRKRGVLVVQSRENILDKRAMLLEEDHISVVDVPATSDVTALMVEAGDIDFALWAEARDKAGSYRIGAVDYLVRRRKVDEDAVSRARRRLQEEEILEIFLWNNVTFSLDEEAQPPANADRAFVVIDQIVMEAARRQDEWRRVVELLGGGGDIFEPVHGAAELVELKELPPVVRIVFESLNGARATQQLVETTSLPRYFVDSAIFTLLEQGFVRRLELEDLVKRGEECLAAGAADDAVRLLKTALRFDRRNIGIHKNLAAAYLLAGRIGKAAQHEKLSGLIQVKAGDFAAATLSFQTAVQHLPTDFKSIERALFSLAHRGGHHTEADRATLDQGLRLFSFHFESKRYDPAERVLESLTSILPHDTDLAFALARLLAKMGRIAESVEHYMRIAGRLYELGDLDGALGAYRTIITVEPSKRDVCQQKIHQIMELQATKRRRRAARRTMVGVSSAFVLVVFGAVGYDGYAAKKLKAMQAGESTEPTDEAGWQARAGRMRAFASQYPLTRASFQARRQADLSVRQAEEAHRRTAEEKRKAAERIADLTNLAKKSFTNGVTLQRQREFALGLDELRNALRRAEEAGDDNWIAQSKVRELIGAVEKHIVWEREKITKHLEAWQAGDMEAAFATAREMLETESGGEKLVNDDIRVLSPEVESKIRVPYRIDVFPNAVRDGDANATPTSAIDTVLSLETEKAAVRLLRDGFKEASVDLTLRDGPYRRTVILTALPKKAAALGHRVFDILPLGAGWVAVGTDGFLARYDSAADEPTWRFIPQAMLQVVKTAVDSSNRVMIASLDGQVAVIEPLTKKLLWMKKLGATHAQMNDRGVFAVVGEKNLVRFTKEDGTEIERWTLPDRCTSLAVFGDRALSILESGGAAMVDLSSRAEPKVIADVAIATVVGFSGDAFVVVDRSGITRSIRPADGTIAVREDLPQKWMLGPVLWNGVTIGFDESGRFFRSDRTDAAPSPLAARHLSGGEIHGVLGGDLYIRTADAGLIRCDLSTGLPRCGYRGTPNQALVPAIVDGALVIGHADDVGKIEFFDAEVK